MANSALTVAQASQHLGISERSLRRLLRDPKIAAKTQAEHRQTRTGQRRVVLLSSDLLLEIADSLRQSFSENTSKNTGRTQAEVMGDYERLLAEKDARIAELIAALEHERTQSRCHADAHKCAQELLRSQTPSARPSLLERFVRRQKRP